MNDKIVSDIFQKWVGETERNNALIPVSDSRRRKLDDIFKKLLIETIGKVRQDEREKFISENAELKARWEKLKHSIRETSLTFTSHEGILKKMQEFESGTEER